MLNPNIGKAGRKAKCQILNDICKEFDEIIMSCLLMDYD
jgi:hypothetical protein